MGERRISTNLHQVPTITSRDPPAVRRCGGDCARPRLCHPGRCGRPRCRRPQARTGSRRTAALAGVIRPGAEAPFPWADQSARPGSAPYHRKWPSTLWSCQHYTPEGLAAEGSGFRVRGSVGLTAEAPRARSCWPQMGTDGPRRHTKNWKLATGNQQLTTGPLTRQRTTDHGRLTTATQDSGTGTEARRVIHEGTRRHTKNRKLRMG